MKTTVEIFRDFLKDYTRRIAAMKDEPNKPAPEPLATGTFKCPICGDDEPHYHDANLQWKRLPADQLGWLIETGDHQYWNGKKANSDGFTHDPNDAVRFARFEDSERVIHWLMSEYRVFLVSRQHSWMGGNAQKALATQREGE